MRQKEMKELMMYKIEGNVLCGADWHKKLMETYETGAENDRATYRRLRNGCVKEAWTIITLMKDFGMITEEQAGKMQDDTYDRIHQY